MADPTPDELRATLYDAENTWAADDDFFLALAAEHPGSRVLDLGCGTGRLTLALSAAGHRVTGIDPDVAALAAAVEKPGGDVVAWIEGTSEAIPADARYELALMTSHVVQAIADDGEWRATLTDLFGALAPGGRLAFDSRDPERRAWERWNPEESRGTTTLPDGTTLEGWFEVTGVDDGVVHLVDHTVLADGTHTTEVGDLAFRSLESLRADVERAGFVVDDVLGGWHGEPVGDGAGELVVVAHRPA